MSGYAITGGADQGFFSIGSASGALTFDDAPNYEDAQDQGNNNRYEVTVQASSGAAARVKTATQTITVTVTDDNTEAPGAPGAPNVSAASVSSLGVTWAAPDNDGPAVTDYDYRYRRTASPPGAWTAVTGTPITGLSATIRGLDEDTSYDVQVRATNAEGTGAWSDSGSGRTDANAAPTFSSSATFDVPENGTEVAMVMASDSDSEDKIERYDITGGADQALFLVIASSGHLEFRDAPNFEDAQDQDTDNDYEVTVQASSGTGEREKTATQAITVTVTDDNTEAPGAPGAPNVSAVSVSSLSVTWAAPDNDGPAVTDYDYRYRTAASQGVWTAVTGTTITGLSATIRGLAENTSYDVQVRATNAEGTGAWSASGRGRDGRECGAGVHLGCGVRGGGEPNRGGHGDSGGPRHGGRRVGLCDHGRRGPGVVRDRRDDRRADVQDGAQLRGCAGPGRRQRLRGDGAGEQRRGGAGEDRDPDHHGDGDGR